MNENRFRWFKNRDNDGNILITSPFTYKTSLLPHIYFSNNFAETRDEYMCLSDDYDDDEQ